MSKHSEILGRVLDALAAADMPTPTTQRFAGFREDPDSWTPESSFEKTWRKAVHRLVDQSALGVFPAAGVAMLDTTTVTSLRENAPAHQSPVDEVAESSPDAASGKHGAGSASATAVDEDWRPRAVQALIAWRAERIDAGVEGADTIRDITLRNLVKFNRTTADEISSVLIGPASVLASEIAEVLSRFAPGPPRDASTPQSATVVDDSAHAPRHAAPSDSQPAYSQPVQTQPAAARPTETPESRIGTVSESAAPTPIELTTPALTVTHGDFCVYEFGEQQPPTAIAIEQKPTSVSLSWQPYPAPSGQVVVYRIVSGEDLSPYKPEAGDLLAADGETSLVDGRFLTGAVRYYQVWCHVGRDDADARRNQPVRWAVGEAVSPVDDFELFEEEGRIIGRWSARPGTRLVRVIRRSLDGGHGGQTPIGGDDANLTGFVDDSADRGRRFLYQARAEVDVDGTGRLSPPVQKEVLVSVALTQVLDLEATSTGPTTFDIVWTAPDAGQRVEIFFSSAAPPAGLDSEDRDASTLSVAGFQQHNQVKDPVRAAADGRSQIVGLRWPTQWDRAYLTPVTSFNGRIRVGRTEVFTRPIPAVIEPRIVERLDTEQVVFGWPQGASAVQVFVGVSTVSSEEICRGPAVAEASSAQYERDGAIVLPGPLPAGGCVVCIVPIAYSRAQQLRGEITALDYAGLRRLRYWLAPIGQNPDPATGAPTSRIVAVGLISPSVIENPPPLVAVWNPDRLPLDPKDGRHVPFLHQGRQPVPHATLNRIQASDRPADTGYFLDLTQVSGYVRLFVYERPGEPSRYALQDPPLNLLQLPPLVGPNPVQHG